MSSTMRKTVVAPKGSKGSGRKPISKKSNPHQRPKKTKSKPEWDDSLSDLGQHKLSSEELDKKRDAVLSANADRAKRLLHDRLKIINAVTQHDRSRDESSRLMNGSPNEKHMSKLMREVMYGENQEVLQNVLRGESQSVDVLEELFGGKALKFTSEPEITSAPADDSDEDGSSSNIMWAPPSVDSPPRLRRSDPARVASAQPVLEVQRREQHTNGFTTTDGENDVDSLDDHGSATSFPSPRPLRQHRQHPTGTADAHHDRSVAPAHPHPPQQLASYNDGVYTLRSTEQHGNPPVPHQQQDVQAPHLRNSHLSVVGTDEPQWGPQPQPLRDAQNTTHAQEHQRPGNDTHQHQPPRNSYSQPQTPERHHPQYDESSQDPHDHYRKEQLRQHEHLHDPPQPYPHRPHHNDGPHDRHHQPAPLVSQHLQSREDREDRQQPLDMHPAIHVQSHAPPSANLHSPRTMRKQQPLQHDEFGGDNGREPPVERAAMVADVHIERHVVPRVNDANPASGVWEGGGAVPRGNAEVKGGARETHLHQFAAVVGALEDKVNAYEQRSGRVGMTTEAGAVTSPPRPGTTTPSFSGFTEKIILLVERLTTHLTDAETAKQTLRNAHTAMEKTLAGNTEQLLGMQSTVAEMQHTCASMAARMASSEARCTQLEAAVRSLGGNTDAAIDRITRDGPATTAPYNANVRVQEVDRAPMHDSAAPSGNQRAHVVGPTGDQVGGSTSALQQRLAVADSTIYDLRRRLVSSSSSFTMPGTPTHTRTFPTTTVAGPHDNLPVGTDTHPRVGSDRWHADASAKGSSVLGGAALGVPYESPLKAAVESAAAATGLSVHELLGKAAIPCTSSLASAFLPGGGGGGNGGGLLAGPSSSVASPARSAPGMGLLGSEREYFPSVSSSHGLGTDSGRGYFPSVGSSHGLGATSGGRGYFPSMGSSHGLGTDSGRGYFPSMGSSHGHSATSGRGYFPSMGSSHGLGGEGNNHQGQSLGNDNRYDPLVQAAEAAFQQRIF